MPIRINVSVQDVSQSVNRAGDYKTYKSAPSKKMLEVGDEFGFLNNSTLTSAQYDSAIRTPIKNRGYGIVGAKVLDSLQSPHDINAAGLDYQTRLKNLPPGVDPLRQMRLEYGNRTGPNPGKFPPVPNPSAMANREAKGQFDAGMNQAFYTAMGSLAVGPAARAVGGIVSGGSSLLGGAIASGIPGQTGVAVGGGVTNATQLLAGLGFAGWYGYETTQGRGALTIPKWMAGQRQAPEDTPLGHFLNAFELTSEAVIGVELTAYGVKGAYKGIQYLAGLFASTKPKAPNWQFQPRLEGYSDLPNSGQSGGTTGQPPQAGPSVSVKYSKPNFGSSGRSGVYEFEGASGDVLEGILKPFGGNLGAKDRMGLPSPPEPTQTSSGRVYKDGSKLRPHGLGSRQTLKEDLADLGISYTGDAKQFDSLTGSMGLNKNTRPRMLEVSGKIEQLKCMDKNDPEFERAVDELADLLNDIAKMRFDESDAAVRKWGGTKFQRDPNGGYEEPEFKDPAKVFEPQPQRQPVNEQKGKPFAEPEPKEKIPVILEEMQKGEIVPQKKPNQEMVPVDKANNTNKKIVDGANDRKIVPVNKPNAEPKLDPEGKPVEDFDPFLWVNPFPWKQRVDPDKPVAMKFDEPPPKPPIKEVGGKGGWDMIDLPKWQAPTFQSPRGGSLPVAPAFYKSAINIPAFILGSGRLEYADN